MIGQCVLVRLAEQYTLGAIAVEHTPDVVDVRAFALFSDGRVGDVVLERLQRGDGVDQWQDAPPWPTPDPEPMVVEVTPPAPLLAAVAAELMPVSQLPAVPRMPLMVIIRHS